MTNQTITPEQFVAEWKGRHLTERASSQAHFIQLCRLLGVDAPLDNRAEDANYCFDALTETAGSHIYAAARVAKPKKGRKNEPSKPLWEEPEAVEPIADDGGELPLSRIVSAKSDGFGFADVWKRGCFCWEYKRQGKHANLEAALRQLKEYKDSLDNPPLLIVCDVDHFEIHTNFTGHPATKIAFRLEDLAQTPREWRDKGLSPLGVLHRAFSDPEWFRPKEKVADITVERAEQVAKLALGIRERKGADGKPYKAHDVAHFLMQIVFCLFAEDVDLLPKDRVTKLLGNNAAAPDRFHSQIKHLFEVMATGGDFGDEAIRWFNGGLFKDIGTQVFPRLSPTEIGQLSIVAKNDWSAVEPAILGTLFERALDEKARAQIGAHYTSRDDIMLIIEPVVLAPLKREWVETQKKVSDLIAKHGGANAPGKKNGAAAAVKEIDRLVKAFAGRLASVVILDPACGSGNFLYVAIQCLLDLEKEVIAFGARPEVGVRVSPKVSPAQLRGIDLNAMAAELARISIWIGYLKWKRENGMIEERRPVLDSLDTIECRDAILDRSDPKKARMAEWPEADFVIGNPPFLGSKLFRKQGISDEYLKALFGAYDLPKTSDLCCYWFELARRAILRRKSTRAGLLATQGIRGGDNRTVLERIKESGDIFMAWADRDWVLDGATVHVSLVGFSSGSSDTAPTLDGVQAGAINASLAAGAGYWEARKLGEMGNLSFQGPVKVGEFQMAWDVAASMLALPRGPNGRATSEVVRPWRKGECLNGRSDGDWIVDFGMMSEEEAVKFEAPFRFAERYVKSDRLKNRREGRRDTWWLFGEPNPNMRRILQPLSRFIVTCQTAKHRLWCWLSLPEIPAQTVIGIGRSDDYFFGVVHSSIHETWARALGTQLREAESGTRYTPSTCLETFAMPWSPSEEPGSPKQAGHALHLAISTAAAELDKLREAWLNPPEWIAEVEKKVDITYRAQLEAVPADVRALVRRSAVMAEAAQDKRLKVRTLTNLYNERPAWLRLAHEKLDRAVLAAYAAVDPKGGWNPEWARVYEPFGAGEIVVKDGKPKKVSGRGGKKDDEGVAEAKRAALAAREPVDAKILGNLLRLNKQRADAGETVK